MGALTVVIIYAIAKNLFDVEVAQWTARFMAFFPQMVFWSGAIYKDPAIMFCIAACMYAVLKLSSAFTGSRGGRRLQHHLRRILQFGND